MTDVTFSDGKRATGGGGKPVPEKVELTFEPGALEAQTQVQFSFRAERIECKCSPSVFAKGLYIGDENQFISEGSVPLLGLDGMSVALPAAGVGTAIRIVLTEPAMGRFTVTFYGTALR